MTGYNKWHARAELARTSLVEVGHAIPRVVRQVPTHTPGVNYLEYSSGSSVSLTDLSELLSLGLDASGLSVAHHFVSAGPQADGAALPPSDDAVFTATVALVQSGHLPTALLQNPRLFRPRRFMASIVHFELPQLPRPQRLGIPLMDEVWTTSGFVQEVFGRYTKKPVRVLPIPVVAPEGQAGVMRRHLGLGDEFIFGFQFDLASSGRRKNPEAVVRAYRAAFPQPSPDVRLLLKSAHSSSDPCTWQQVRRAAANREDIILVDDFWPRDAIDAFFLDIDCYVSLHRAEGYGMTIAKAMAAGKPVVATGYSGNMEFMKADDSVPIPFRTVPVGPDPIYPANGTWAEPDVDVAADAMRSLAADRTLAAQLGGRARARVLGGWTPQRLGGWLRSHLPVEAVRQ